MTDPDRLARDLEIDAAVVAAMLIYRGDVDAYLADGRYVERLAAYRALTEE